MGKLERQRADARLQLDKHRQSVERQIRSAYAHWDARRRSRSS